ncbi:MAG: DUF418 domain-containing protein [Bacteroidota bacterium]
MTTTTRPTTGKERIAALDILRGFAILGILVMNIQTFAMPGAAYLNPMAYGDLTGANQWVWILSHVLADNKFMTIFSLLYGAGIVLVTERAEAKTGKSAGLHYRRNLWLLVIGLIHAHLIWYGDILVTYSLCALFAFLLRKKKPWTLVVIGTLMISIHSLFYLFTGMNVSEAGGAMDSWNPGAAAIALEIAEVTGTLTEQIRHNSQSALMMETTVFLMLFLWRAGGLILIGMALYKWGIITGQRSRTFYVRCLLISWALGFPLVIYGVVKNFQADWAMEYSMFLGSQFNYWGSIGVSLGYISVIMLFAQSSTGTWIKDRLAAIGQMALTNYIAQSLIGVFIFYGVGFALFGQVDRVGQILITVAIWMAQLLWSRPWLRRYHFGPLEWVWRSLTYQKRQKWAKAKD